MRIAVISDIHGNLLALDAVLTDIEQQDIDEVWCGGDVVWGGPWGEECLRRVRTAGWPTVKGNTDVWVTGDPQTASSDEERRDIEEMAAAHALTDDDARWLLNLPVGHTGSGSILLVHGTPETPFTAPMPDAPAAEFQSFEGKAGLVVYAHVHRAFVRRLSDGTVVCNTGSIGYPMDGPTASYLVIDQRGPEWLLTQRRVEFDRRAVIAQAKEIDGPIGAWTLDKLGAP